MVVGRSYGAWHAAARRRHGDGPTFCCVGPFPAVARSRPLALLLGAMAKRGPGSELNKDNWESVVDAEGDSQESLGTWQKADDATLAGRKIRGEAAGERAAAPGRRRWRRAGDELNPFASA